MDGLNDMSIMECDTDQETSSVRLAELFLKNAPKNIELWDYSQFKKQKLEEEKIQANNKNEPYSKFYAFTDSKIYPESQNATIAELKYELSRAYVQNKKLKSDFYIKCEQLKLEKSELANKLSNVELSYKKLMAENNNITEEIVHLKNKTSETILSLRKQLVEVSENKCKTEEQLSEIKRELNEFKCNSGIEILQLKDDLLKLENQIEESNLNLELEKEKNRKFFEEKKASLQLQEELMVAKQKIQQLEYELSVNKDAATFNRLMQAKITKLPQMESELLELRRQNSSFNTMFDNMSLCEEKIKNLQNQLDHAEKRCQNKDQIERQNVLLQEELNVWRQMAFSLQSDDKENIPSHIFMQQYIGKLQREQLQLKETNLHLQSRFQKKNIQQLQLSLKEKDSLIQANMKSERKHNNKILRLEMERDIYKELVQKYENQMTMSFSTDDQILHQKLSLFMQQLQVIIAAEEPIESSRDRNCYIYHLRENPFTCAVKSQHMEIQLLQKENQALRDRVKLMEEGHKENLTLLLGEQIQKNTDEEVKELKKTNAALKKINKTILESFEKTGQEWRLLIYLLIGYRVDKINHKYKVTSMYAEKEEDHFLFELTPEQELKMLETESSKEFYNEFQFYILQHHSIPGFLSQVTIELLKKQTVVSF